MDSSTTLDHGPGPVARETDIAGVTRTEGVCGGAACLAGLRLPVWTLENARRLGESVVDLQEAYPFLSVDQIQTAFRYAARHPREMDVAIAENDVVACENEA